MRFESIHPEYGRPVGCVSALTDGHCRDPAMGSANYFRVVDVVTHQVISTSFGIGHVFGSAMVQPAEDSANGTVRLPYALSNRVHPYT